MRYCNQGWFRQQVSFLRRQFLQDGDLPFTNVLSEQIVAQALTAIQAFWMDRIYSPLVTLWVFLGQVLSADHFRGWGLPTRLTSVHASPASDSRRSHRPTLRDGSISPAFLSRRFGGPSSSRKRKSPLPHRG